MEHSFELDSIVTFAVWRTSTLYGLLMKYIQNFGIDFSSTKQIKYALWYIAGLYQNVRVGSVLVI